MKIPGLPPLRIPVAELIRRRPTWSPPAMVPSAGDARLEEMGEFGVNPGQLRMLRYVPADLPAGAPLVVVLHGCTQTAGGYDLGSGWSVLAERHRFALLVPEQRRSNNRNLCFNWFEPEDTTRGSGEVASIRSMVARMQADLRSDPARVFVTGLSAGGAMASAMLATYPDVFSAGAIIAGLPYRCALNTSEALGAMYRCPHFAGSEWGDRIRQASPKPQRRPIVSIWHGEADATVAFDAAAEHAKQWCDVHGLEWTSSVDETIDGATHRVWRDRGGVARVELYAVPGLGHGTPITPHAPGEHGVGEAMPHVLEATISSTWRIARSWGLVPDETSVPQLAKAAATSPAELMAKTMRAAFGL